MSTDLVEVVEPAGDLARSDRLRQFTEDWLANRRFSDHTREAYRRDVNRWLDWCEDNDLDPVRAHFTDVNRWSRELERPPDGSRGLAPASAARRLSGVSSWYNFLIKLGVLQLNPALLADRPEVDRHYSSTVSFSAEQADAMLDAAADGDVIGPVGPLLAAWLIAMGTRASETTQLTIGDLSYSRGARIVDLTVKGNRKIRRTIPEPLAAMLAEYLASRGNPTSGRLFVHGDGRPINRHALYRFVQRLAKRAGLPNWARITPHSFRHAWNAEAKANGASLEDRGDAMGHRDPATTRRYDRSAGGLTRDPALLVAAAIERRREAREQNGSQQ